MENSKRAEKTPPSGGKRSEATMGGVFEGTQPYNGRLCCGYLAVVTLIRLPLRDFH